MLPSPVNKSNGLVEERSMNPITSGVAVVTGGSRGIGRGIALALARAGHSVVVNYRTDRAAALATCAQAEELGSPRSIPVQADVSDLARAREFVDECEALEGRIDLWVNNAGVAPRERLDLLETTPESWDTVIATNLRGPFFLTQQVAQTMVRLRAKGITPEPRIVFITSISSTFASVSRGEYCVAKAGLSMVVQLFAVRLASLGIGVYELRPGLIDTDMTAPVHQLYQKRIDAGLIPIPRWGVPDDVGRAVAAIAAGAFPYSTGAVIPIDGGLDLRIL
jgi:3-oxoacyl-[acyl-carrier protein] reductase